MIYIKNGTLQINPIEANIVKRKTRSYSIIGEIYKKEVCTLLHKFHFTMVGKGIPPCLTNHYEVGVVVSMTLSSTVVQTLL